MNENAFDPAEFLSYVKHDKPRAAIELLERSNGDVNYRYEDGWTALMHAANEGGRRVVPALLEYNADVNAQNAEGKTALIIAAESDEQYTEIIESLLKHNPDVDIQDNNGNTAEMVATPEVADMIAEYRNHRVPEAGPPPSEDVPMDYGAARRRKTRRKGKKGTKKSKKTRKGKGRR